MLSQEPGDSGDNVGKWGEEGGERAERSDLLSCQTVSVFSGPALAHHYTPHNDSGEGREGGRQAGHQGPE